MPSRPSEIVPDSGPELRLVLAVSLDGRLAPPSGGAAQLGGPADRRLLEEALAWADGCLIGAETLRRHGTTCLLKEPDLLELRRRRGQPLQPVAVVVSRTGRLPTSLPFFRQPLERWLLLSPPTPSGVAWQAAATPASPSDQRFHRHQVLEGWAAALQDLTQHGLQRIVVLGGSGLASSLLAEDRIDELQLTVCPLLLGGEHSWVLPSVMLPAAMAPTWRLLEHRPLGRGGELLLRYRRGERPGG